MSFRIQVKERDQSVDNVVEVAMAKVPYAKPDRQNQQPLHRFEYGDASQTKYLPLLLVRQVQVLGHVQVRVHGWLETVMIPSANRHRCGGAETFYCKVTMAGCNSQVVAMSAVPRLCSKS